MYSKFGILASCYFILNVFSNIYGGDRKEWGFGSNLSVFFPFLSFPPWWSHISPSFKPFHNVRHPNKWGNFALIFFSPCILHCKLVLAICDQVYSWLLWHIAHIIVIWLALLLVEHLLLITWEDTMLRILIRIVHVTLVC